MTRQILIACLPYLAAIVVSVVALRVLVALSGARLKISQLWQLHRDQHGGVQSLSFVVTLPVFMMILMFIVQLSQLTIAKIVVEYAAFAAARSAVVWIPADLGPGLERPNEIENLQYVRQIENADGNTWTVYQVTQDGPKHNKIHLAAAAACMPIAPSRETGQGLGHAGMAALPSMLRAYRSVAPEAVLNTRIPNRLRNKLGYCLENTFVRIEVRHNDGWDNRTRHGFTDYEPPLMRHEIGPHIEEFTPHEIGWQDQLIVTVTHNFALLPGPGRLLARPADAPIGSSPDESYSARAQTSSASDSASSSFDAPSPPSYGGSGYGGSGYDPVAQHIGRRGTVYVYAMSATVQMNNEGEKSVLPYLQRVHSAPAALDAGWYAEEYTTAIESNDPFAVTTPSTDPFAGGGRTDPFAGDGGNSDPFAPNGEGASDPFGEGGGRTDPFEGGGRTDPFSGGERTDPFGEGTSPERPFDGNAPPANDPFGETPSPPERPQALFDSLE